MSTLGRIFSFMRTVMPTKVGVSADLNRESPGLSVHAEGPLGQVDVTLGSHAPSHQVLPANENVNAQDDATVPFQLPPNANFSQRIQHAEIVTYIRTVFMMEGMMRGSYDMFQRASDSMANSFRRESETNRRIPQFESIEARERYLTHRGHGIFYFLDIFAATTGTRGARLRMRSEVLDFIEICEHFDLDPEKYCPSIRWMESVVTSRKFLC